MESSLKKLIEISRQIECHDPILAYDLTRNLHGRVISVVNPSPRNISHEIHGIVDALEAAKGDLEKVVNDYDTAEEFADIMIEGWDAEEELKKLVDEAWTPKTAGVWDKVKGLFNKKEQDPSSEDTYSMGEEDVDAFVEGKSDWEEPSKYIEKETVDQKDFFKSSKLILDDIQYVRQQAEEGTLDRFSLKDLLEDVKALIARGKALLPKKPSPKMPAPKNEKGNVKLDVVNHYIDMIQSDGDDRDAVIGHLKHLFQEVGPSLGLIEKAQIAAEPVVAGQPSKRGLVQVSSLIKISHAIPSLRKKFLPIIAAAVKSGASSVRMTCK
jgi:hypothetical protein